MKELRMKKFESTEEAEVAYENLRRCFDVMMKQYKGLEEEIGSLKLQIKELNAVKSILHARIRELEGEKE